MSQICWIIYLIFWKTLQESPDKQWECTKWIFVADFVYKCLSIPRHRVGIKKIRSFSFFKEWKTGVQKTLENMQFEIVFLTGRNYMLVKVYSSLWKLFLLIGPRKLNTIRPQTWPRCISLIYILVTWPNKNGSSNLGHISNSVLVRTHLFLRAFSAPVDNFSTK